MQKITGGCLCGKVRYEVLDSFESFHLCHCLQCRKITGSSHASNLFTATENMEILAGEEYIKNFSDPERDFSKCFCSICGSGLPHHSKSGTTVVIPAGSLDSGPGISPQDNIFWSERARWYDRGRMAKCYDRFPE